MQREKLRWRQTDRSPQRGIQRRSGERRRRESVRRGEINKRERERSKSCHGQREHRGVLERGGQRGCPLGSSQTRQRLEGQRDRHGKERRQYGERGQVNRRKKRKLPLAACWQSTYWAEK
ncbi:hypothetical protein TB2_043699 [Malus domestica]